MKSKNFYTISAISLGLFLWIANAAGPGTVQNIDRTGSPLSPGACAACHEGGAFAPSMTAELLDSGMPVLQYEPDKTYTLRVRVNAGAGSPARYGFQAVALTSAGNTNAGTWGATPTGFKKITMQGREYVEHNTPRSSNTLEMPWTAPASAAESIRFYASAIAANNNSNSSGDSPAQLTEALTIAPFVSRTSEVAGRTIKVEVLGNPVQDALRLNVTAPRSGLYQFALTSMGGETVWRHAERLQNGENALQFDTNNLPQGVYLFQVRHAGLEATVKIVR